MTNTTNPKKTNKTTVIDSIPNKPVVKIEASSKGLQVWSVSPPGVKPVPCVAGIEWKDVEDALARAIENGYYVP